ncbi:MULTISPECIES: M3 family metallopeptidase [unclassified Siphonobacter]|uniref:M3 family metallopeptidase n=1 Tax=unclassified Siphonobacter TaxID=2635712 RepID=UPI000CC0672D|nr:peptidyl-dipeptidase Dcp [Siphonobacter sp. SORGH_AS_1065]MDR6195765.1 peptidyl-dipeptidase Dcp [Siphonobacter sp. SORGH_AS_0500]PKK37499.1 peptidase M3 [Siphonobacter sp. SORGH_AS_0500]
MKLKQLPLLLSLAASPSLIHAQGPNATVKSVPMEENPLLQAFKTPFETPAYDKIKVEHFIPAIQEGMKQGRKDIDIIISNAAKPTFQNTIVALENAGELLSRVTPILFHLNSAETTPEIQKTVREASPLLTDYSNDISLNDKLFARVKAVWDERDKLKLNKEDQMLLEKTYKGFARSGANLSETDKNKLREINKELSQLSIEFNEHNLAETNEYSLVVTDEKRLSGLPDFVKEAAKATAKKMNKEGWVFTLQAPSYGPFMQYADDAALRKELWLAYNKRGFKGDKNDNQEIIQKIVKLRYEKAKLLGYKTWADYVLEERMAENPAKVMEFEKNLLNYAKPAAEREIKELTEFARKQGYAEPVLQRWDAGYYAEKLKKEKYSINDELLKPYFKLENVLEGLFTLTNKLYGLTFKERKDIPTWNEEVKTYEILDDKGQLLAIWYGDYFPRPGKRAGAWNSGTRSQHFANGKDVRPHVLNVCNFTRPTETTPSLLTFREVETLFHEFGHALHAMSSHVKYDALSGTSVSWDFVELPSQFMENFCLEPEVLKLFAKHYQTGEVIPQEYIEKLKASSNFMAGVGTARQINLGLTDMAWHGQVPSGKTVAQVEAEVAAQTEVYPIVEGTALSPAFAHIFAGGYSAGYYSYMWSEVLDADAFDLFKQKGIFNKQVAKSFRDNILSKGGTEKPMELYKRFRGREPQPDAMLRRAGLIAQ